MSAATRVSGASGARLFAGYAVVSLMPILVLGAVLAHGNREDALHRGLEYARAQTAVIEEMAIAPALSGEDLRRGITSGEQLRLQAATDLAIYRGSVVRLRLRSFDGRVVFSDDGSVSDALPSSDPAFVKAATGSVDVKILSPTRATRTIRVLQPVLANASGQSVGVLELYLPFTAAAAEIRAATMRTYWRLGAGLSLLYVILAAISWSTTRGLRRHAAEREHESLHDSLTGLANRILFRRRLEESTRRQSAGAVVLVDLDRFKTVNDTLGHQAGDDLLREVGRRLSSSLRSDDTVARLGGDEFGLLLPGVCDPGTAHTMVAKTRKALEHEMMLDGVPLTMEASFGVAFYPRDGDEAGVLLRCADAAMYHGKRSTSPVVVYDPAVEAVPSTHLSIQGDIRRAIDNDELRLHYQPIVDLTTGRVSCLEALLRWQHPQQGLIGPGEFLAAVEPTHLIQPLTQWVIRRALQDCANWTAAGQGWELAVNVSARNLDAPTFAPMVAQLLTDYAVAPTRLHLEVTETALATDHETAVAALNTLAKLGIRWALDDFGVGYANISRLRALPLSEVKIDRDFLARIDVSDQDRRLAAALIHLAHELGMRVTAEGVESAATTDWLRQQRCEHAQGYYFARPAPWWQLLHTDAIAASLIPTPAVMTEEKTA